MNVLTDPTLWSQSTMLVIFKSRAKKKKKGYLTNSLQVYNTILP